MQAGNPCLSSIVRSLKTTYGKECWQLGYAEQSARAMTNAKHLQLMRALHTEAHTLLLEVAAQSSMPPIYRFRAASKLLLLLRDATAFALEWQAGVRAHNAGIMQAADLQDRRGNALLPQLLQTEFPFAAGFKWQFAPNGTKPCQGRRAGSLALEVLPEAEQCRDVLQLVHKLLQVRCWDEPCCVMLCCAL